MQAVTLAAEAVALLRRRMAREYVEVTGENRPLYRELMAAGLMEPITTFLHGREGNCRPTEAAIAFLATCPASPPPPHAATPPRRG